MWTCEMVEWLGIIKDVLTVMKEHGVLLPITVVFLPYFYFYPIIILGKK